MRRMKHSAVVIASVSLSIILLIQTGGCAPRDIGKPAASASYDLVVYGGGVQAVSTVLKASNVRPAARILMIVPDRALGSILTMGRQNIFDINYFRPTELPQGIPETYLGAQAGTLYYLLKDLSIAFPPAALETYLSEKIKARSNVDILYEHDVADVSSSPARNGQQISSLEIRQLKRNEAGAYRFDDGAFSKTIQGSIFIDASETGRLVRLSGHHVGTVGREDQNPDCAQMAATLMFKLRGIHAAAAITDYRLQGKVMSELGSYHIWGGHEMNSHGAFIQYDGNSKHFKLKPYNAGEDGYSGKGDAGSASMDFWMNMLLIYGVDARKDLRDKDSANGWYPQDGGMDPEEARQLAIEELKRPEFMETLRKLRGFEQVELVTAGGEPVVGEILYVRESIHTANEADPQRRHYRFALDREGVTGGDAKYKERRIGLGYYPFDSNSYVKGEQLSNPKAKEPWFVPYDVLLNPILTNVLIPGYAANIDSFAWTAMRVYPNLIMLGDAAGVASGLALSGQFDLKEPTPEQMRTLQKELRKQQVILDK
jgi:hypothetical protein